MINALLVNNKIASESTKLLENISNSCPELNISSLTLSKKNHQNEIRSKNPKLVFLDVEDDPTLCSIFFQQLKNATFELIFISSKRDFVSEAIQYNICGYLLKPLDPNSLRSSVDNAVNRILQKKKDITFVNNLTTFSSNQIIGIPTMEGYEFILIQDILRCESYLKCTRVITQDRSDIISSYNIGEFSKALGKYGFYAPHQSYLINLCKVKKYLKEGTIIMRDGTVIPVSRRRRNEFLQHIPHI